MAAAKAVEPLPRISRSYMSSSFLSRSTNDPAGGNASRIVAHHRATKRQEVTHTWICDTIVHLFSSARSLHQSTPAQAPQVGRDAALRSANSRDELTDSAPTVRCIKEQVQQAHPCWVGEYLEKAGIEFRLDRRKERCSLSSGLICFLYLYPSREIMVMQGSHGDFLFI